MGVNDYVAQEKGIELLQIDETITRRQSEKLKKLRAERSNDEVTRRLNALRKAAAGTANLMPFIYDAVKAYATLGEICDAMRETFRGLPGSGDYLTSVHLVVSVTSSFPLCSLW